MLAVFDWINHHSWAFWVLIILAGFLAIVAYRRSG